MYGNVYVSAYASVYANVYVSAHVCAYASVYGSVYASMYASAYVSAYETAYASAYGSTYVSAYMNGGIILCSWESWAQLVCIIFVKRWYIESSTVIGLMLFTVPFVPAFLFKIVTRPNLNDSGKIPVMKVAISHEMDGFSTHTEMTRQSLPGVSHAFQPLTRCNKVTFTFD